MIISEKKIFKIISIMIGLLVVLSILGQISKYFLGHETLLGFVYLFNVDAEYNIPTFFQVALLFFAAFIIFIIIKSNNSKKVIPKHYLITLLAVSIYIGIDEAVLIHEKIMGAITENIFNFEMHGMFYYSWVIIGGIIALIFIIYFTFLIIRIDKKIRVLLIVSAFLYLFGAIIMEMLGGFYVEKYGLNFTSQILATIEEGAEMFGIAIFVKTLLKYINLNLENTSFNIIINE